MSEKVKLYYRTATAEERTSLAAVLTAHGFTEMGPEALFVTSPVISIDTTKKEFSFVAIHEKGMRKISMTMILNNAYRVKRTIVEPPLGYIAGYSAYMTKEGARFGCQTVSHTNIEKIYKASKAMQEELKKGEFEEL